MRKRGSEPGKDLSEGDKGADEAVKCVSGGEISSPSPQGTVCAGDRGRSQSNAWEV